MLLIKKHSTFPLLILTLFISGCDLIFNNDSSGPDGKLQFVFEKFYDLPDAAWSEPSDNITVSSGGFLIVGRTAVSGNRPFFLRLDEDGNKIKHY